MFGVVTAVVVEVGGGIYSSHWDNRNNDQPAILDYMDYIPMWNLMLIKSLIVW